MTLPGTRPSLFRSHTSESGGRVTFGELFFDLVFVFAITQLSHFTLEHLNPVGAAQAAILIVAVWWVWNYTTWTTNWLNPDSGAVRGMLIALMLLGLLLSTSIPEAFGERSLAFAIAYVTMQIGRTAFVVALYWRSERANAINMLRITIWFVVSAPFWIGGALAGAAAAHPAAGDVGAAAEGLHATNVITPQLWLWLIAILIDVAGPTARYYVPRLGQSALSTWTVIGGHMAERCALFVIIALGESILVAGAGFSTAEITVSSGLSFGAAFAGTILLWLLYFSRAANSGSQFISHATQSGAIARLSYVYAHIPIIAGIVIVAVGDDLVQEHPFGVVDLSVALTVGAGPALYLVAISAFKRSVGLPWLLGALVGAAVILVVGFAFVAVGASGASGAEWATPLLLSWIVNALMAGVLVLDERRAWSSERVLA